MDAYMLHQQGIKSHTIPLDRPPSMQEFINGSRQSLEHLRLAALSQIREAIDQRNQLIREDVNLRKEWETARDEFISKIRFSPTGLDIISQRVSAEIEQLTSNLGEITAHDIRKVKEAIEGIVGVKLRASLSLHFESWATRAIRI